MNVYKTFEKTIYTPFNVERVKGGGRGSETTQWFQPYGASAIEEPLVPSRKIEYYNLIYNIQ